jgi:hypothetical protein
MVEYRDLAEVAVAQRNSDRPLPPRRAPIYVKISWVKER